MQPLLSEEASKAVKKLLPEHAEGDLASLCSWADEMRLRYHWASPLHFIDTPDKKCSYVYSSKFYYPIETSFLDLAILI